MSGVEESPARPEQTPRWGWRQWLAVCAGYYIAGFVAGLLFGALQ